MYIDKRQFTSASVRKNARVVFSSKLTDKIYPRGEKTFSGRNSSSNAIIGEDWLIDWSLFFNV